MVITEMVIDHIIRIVIIPIIPPDIITILIDIVIITIIHIHRPIIMVVGIDGIGMDIDIKNV